ncbi:mevalonate kinase [Streptomyces sp. NPDC088736]|uniref:mevalonate kinase family protein n=1 Tax=Streptomyces sp. NPDC088736 TaxID=3365881 RepID=UPI00381BB5A6
MTHVWRALGTHLGLDLGAMPEISVHAEAPIGSGLSSSTSLTIALTQACLNSIGCRQFSRGELIRFSYEVEKSMTNGGGMDHVSIVDGGVVYLQGSEDDVPKTLGRGFWPQDVGIILIDSGVEKSCADHIAITRQKWQNGDTSLREYARLTEGVADTVWNILKKGDSEALYSSIDTAHDLMRDFQGMSTPVLEKIRDVALTVGCRAVKLTGSGGGGCLFSLVPAVDVSRTLSDLEEAYNSLGYPVSVQSVKAAAPRTEEC